MKYYNVTTELGLSKLPRFYLDVGFVLALVSGGFFVWLAHDWLPVFSSDVSLSGWLFMSLIIWQPIIEELFFRGFVQGQLLKYQWAKLACLHITAANAVTSVLFIAIHLIAVPSLWSLLIFIPSLLFGYFREVFRSVYPSIFLHSSYNLFVVLGILIKDINQVVI